MTFSRPVINQSACGIYLSHIIIILILINNGFDDVRCGVYSLTKLLEMLLSNSKFEIASKNEFWVHVGHRLSK